MQQLKIMLRMKCFICFFLISVFACLFSFSALSKDNPYPPDITRTDSLYTLTESAQVFVDPTASLSFATIRQQPFQPFSYDLLRKAHWQDVVWLKIAVHNRLSIPGKWLLHTGKASFVDVYISQPGNRFEYKKSGYYRRNSERDEIRGKENSVHVWLMPGENKVYIRYQNQLRIGLAPNVRLQSVESWNEYIIERNLYEGIAQGVLLVLFLYNFLLYFTLKRKTYLYYSLYILALSVFYLNIYNLGKELLLGEFPAIFDYNWATLQLVVIFLLLFISDFLDTRKRFPRTHKNIELLILINIIWGITGVVYYFFSKNLALIFSIHRYFNLLQFVNILVLLVLFWGSKAKTARLLVIGTLPLFVGGLWDVLFRDASDVTKVHVNYFQVGAIIQLILFSLSIGYKMKEQERRRRRAKEKLIVQLRENQQLKDKLTISLEQKVRARTQELQLTNEELLTLNREKTRLISIIAHDLNSPLNALKGLLYIFENDLVSEQELKQLIPEVSKDVNYIASLFNNLLVWARSQIEGSVLQPKEIDLKAMTCETIQLLETQAKRKNIQLKNLIQQPVKAYADEEMTKLVIRNLLSNAIKFTPDNGQITVQAALTDSQAEIAVQDNGQGIPAENRDKLFNNELFTQRGTNNEKGSGLGLILCKDFVERNGGTIRVESEEGKGSTFYFTVSLLVPQASQPTVVA